MRNGVPPRRDAVSDVRTYSRFPVRVMTAETTASTEEAWKIEFEKSLLENYGVTPEYYEDLGNGIYQVYVNIDGKVVPYVVVDSATGDYHG